MILYYTISGDVMESISVLHIVIAKTWGGGEQYVYDVCKEMRRKGIDVFVIVDETNEKFKKKFSEVSNVLTANLYFAAGMFGVSNIIKYIKNFNISIVNCHSGHAMLMCMLIKMLVNIKLVMFKHNTIAAKNDIYHNWQRKCTDAFICVSQLVYDLQIDTIDNKYKDKYYLVYNGIDLEKLNKHGIVEKDKDNFIIGYAGRIAKDKGINILIKAFEKVLLKHNDITLNLAGSDEKEYLKIIQKYVKNNKLENKIRYLGHVDDMEKFYKRLNLFVLPSVVKESFGLVLCEAIYCGIPVITTDSGAQYEIIKNDDLGYVVKAGDVDALAEKIEYVYSNKNGENRNIDILKKYIENNFSISICVDKILSVYKNIRN